MPHPDFYNQNMYQRYPLVPSAAGLQSYPASLLDEYIVDCGFIIGPRGSWNYESHSINLKSVGFIATSGNSSTAVFETLIESPTEGTLNLRWTFTYTPPSGFHKFATAWAIPNLGVEYGMGYVVWGGNKNLSGVLNISSGAKVDPSNIQNLTGAVVTRVHVGSEFSTRYVSPSGCDDQPVVNTKETFKRMTPTDGLTGDLVFRSGRYMDIQPILSDNALSFGATVTPEAGGELPCEPIRTDPDANDIIPTFSNPILYDHTKMPLCSGLEGAVVRPLVFSLNGISAQNKANAFTILGGNGVSVLAGLTPHEILIKVATVDLYSEDPITPECENP